MSEKCKHEPDLIGALLRTCKLCGSELDYIPCKSCEGTGAKNGVRSFNARLQAMQRDRSEEMGGGEVMSTAKPQHTIKEGDRVNFIITRSTGYSYSFSVRLGEVVAIRESKLMIKYRGRNYWVDASECRLEGQNSALSESIARKVVNRE